MAALLRHWKMWKISLTVKRRRETIQCKEASSTQERKEEEMDRWSIFVWFVAPGGVVASFAALALSVRRRRRLAIAIGGLAVLVASAVMVSSWDVDSSGFEDIVLVLSFFWFVLPLLAFAILAALIPGQRRRGHIPGSLLEQDVGADPEARSVAE